MDIYLLMYIICVLPFVISIVSFAKLLLGVSFEHPGIPQSFIVTLIISGAVLGYALSFFIDPASAADGDCGDPWVYTYLTLMHFILFIVALFIAKCLVANLDCSNKKFAVVIIGLVLGAVIGFSFFCSSHPYYKSEDSNSESYFSEDSCVCCPCDNLCNVQSN